MYDPDAPGRSLGPGLHVVRGGGRDGEGPCPPLQSEAPRGPGADQRVVARALRGDRFEGRVASRLG